jgi:hypothetical protein
LTPRDLFTYRGSVANSENTASEQTTVDNKQFHTMEATGKTKSKLFETLEYHRDQLEVSLKEIQGKETAITGDSFSVIEHHKEELEKTLAMLKDMKDDPDGKYIYITEQCRTVELRATHQRAAQHRVE